MKKKREVAKINPNLVKTNNKLLGEVEMGNLYNDDDGDYDLGAFGGQIAHQHEPEPDYHSKKDLDFGLSNRRKQEAP